jgi:hypothetical protein
LIIPLANRKIQEGIAPDPLLHYRATESILCLSEYNGYSYDALLRSDLDAFLMPGFARWVPPAQDTLVVGNGGYGHVNANAHLAHISKVLKLDTKEGLIGLGSTWFGNSKLMVATAKLAVSVMRWMDTQEFSAYEKCCSGTSSWSHWHWPVLSMYGSHIALNHVS